MQMAVCPMFRLASSVFLLSIITCSAHAETGYYGYGASATDEQIAGWDIDVRPDGLGLPEGSGSVEDGEWVYEEKCAECHGSFGEGVGRYPPLAGGEGSLTEDRPHRTVGSYWPHASTLWDYIHRAMPYTAPESLEDDEVYALTAYVLYLNDLVEDDFVLDRESFKDVVLPNNRNFFRDDRPDTNNTRCMKNCKDPASIVVTSMVAPPSPVQAVAVAPSAEHDGVATYQKACALCHDAGIGGAPTLGDADAWSDREARGLQALVDNAINGYQGEAGVMPPKGGFLALSDEEVEAAVSYMLEQSQ